MVGRRQLGELSEIFGLIARFRRSRKFQPDTLIVFLFDGMQQGQLQRYFAVKAAGHIHANRAAVGIDEGLPPNTPFHRRRIALEVQIDMFAVFVIIVADQIGTAAGSQIKRYESRHHDDGRTGKQQPRPRLFIPDFGFFLRHVYSPIKLDFSLMTRPSVSPS